MDIKLNTVHFDADQKLIDFTKKRVTKLEQFFDGIIASEVYLAFDKSRAKKTDNKEAKIKLEIPGNDLFAEKKEKTFEEAIDNTVKALETQLKKHKEKIRK
ncbi:MAG: ribosome-associated translation inhibitor RaiA [Bacteroidota bacterium]|nr:ribosome-associated translation inhibitor RaiA [Bacteroidota bacterium]